MDPIDAAAAAIAQVYQCETEFHFVIDWAPMRNEVALNSILFVCKHIVIADKGIAWQLLICTFAQWFSVIFDEHISKWAEKMAGPMVNKLMEIRFEWNILLCTQYQRKRK